MIIFVLLAGLFSCEHPPGATVRHRITIKNNTYEDVWYLMSYNYPDTSAPSNNEYLSLIRSKSAGYEDSKKKWDKVFAEDIQGDKLMIFIFDNEIVENYSWDQIRDNYMVLKRIEVSLQELKDNKYEINYP